MLMLVDGSIGIGKIDQLDDGRSSRPETQSAFGLFPRTFLSLPHIPVERCVL